MSLFKSAGIAAALTFAVASAALAAGPELNASSTGLALQGYDPVAYFTEGQATKGNYTITATHEEATYWFSSEEHKAAFEANPDAYAPEYGGYCAFGAAMGFKFDGDPHHWKIVDGELYLNLSKDIQERWSENIPGFIEQADANWVTIESATPASLQN
ncbi:YHS domain-containing (seleno)protein [Pacificoceanicola onchidii]|uniref:YHS domain-containing (seleno)protein n=1 Tax=Pacificoceanicola onchidii TaxID=2562685 RepID=UPI0010A5FDC3|nr:YHS domain-containing (seleno)protein [Pacificoceanicola onchidii]